MQLGDESEMFRSRLRSFCDNGFEGSTEAAALVLGRDGSDLDEMLRGEVPIDEDLSMKVNAIAEERGIPLGGN